MHHSFDTDIAKEYGILEAVLLENINFWIDKNAANGKHYHDGYYWTYNSTRAFAELFQYASARQISTALKKLIDKGILITGNYNQIAYDRTLWYALTEKGKSIIQKCEMEDTNVSNRITENVEPIPNINTNINKYKHICNTDNAKEEKEQPKKEENIFAGYSFSDEMKQSIKDWLAYKAEKKSAYKPRGLATLIKQLDKAVKQVGEQAVIATIENSMTNNYQGIFFDKLGNNKQTKTQKKEELSFEPITINGVTF